ncbi:hypothetical protein LAZ40_04795 [Cereibacter sphaeroides]|uniref:hypothetical protein n=1 Tax=Cereibacter sphaeroides TaxID=1063 RepID=UPI001F1B1A8E|nr:hypothetical protein [Cereibacter sphaeroides]MCE6958374.1 hypothetical protein [Cereibacter sphaeroides]MCE6972241.1 hypothetical protein [Cereibacter sphaeroides]
MRMFIPEIGTKIVLSAPWTINVQNEYRNAVVFGLLAATREDLVQAGRIEATRLREEARTDPPGLGYVEQRDRRARLYQRADAAESLEVTLPAGTELSVDRIYIRKGVSDYSSLTFNLTKTTHPDLNRKGRKRFWVKLAEVNRMEFELAPGQAEKAPAPVAAGP